ncbi:MAG: serine/threonine protein phosphatase [Clostridia bacterium]|nr:serine/threonine protein phosphatase [Clostridia bacterium]
MALRKKKKGSQPETVAVSQTGKNNHPFYLVGSYFPSAAAEASLYKSLREAVPIIDAAIYKLIRLLGKFSVSTGNKRIDKELSIFLDNVSVGGTRMGINAFLATFFEQLLTYGTAVGEMIISGGTLSHLYNADLKSVSLSHGKSPVEIIVSADNGMGRFEPVRYPQLILTCVHNPEPGNIYGTSILKGLPFVSDILLKIYNTIGVNWERVGNIRYAVTYKPQNDALDKAYAKERAMTVASEWSKAMDGNGPVKDFVAVGDVSIKAIGADNQILDSEIPVRQMLEQIVAKMGIPPFLLGLSWSSTERMSYQQADILTSEIDAYRRELTPIIRKICLMWLRLNGYDCDAEIIWESVTLQDITELAKSELYTAQAEKIYWETAGEKKLDT